MSPNMNRDTIQPMQAFQGRVSQIQLWGGRQVVRVACPQKMIPASGKYTLAWAEGDADAPLATPLFTAQVDPDGFLAAPGAPPHWGPGTRLHLRGPLGRGFDLPLTARSVALAACSATVARLLPLMRDALAQEAAVALFTDNPLPALPLDLEVHPLSALPEALSWADYLALDLPVEMLDSLGRLLGVDEFTARALPAAQALVLTPMLCGGMADCAVCAVKTGRKWKMACKDGPVFNLKELYDGRR